MSALALSREARIKQAETALNEGRVAQGFWRKRRDGRELVCALAAFGPDINSSRDCPADLMPQWLSYLVPVLDDGIASADVPWFMAGLIDRAKRWHVLDTAAWNRLRTGFMVAGIRQAVESAAKVQPDPRPAYWSTVTDACDQVIEALQTRQGLAEARKAAAAAAAEAAAAAKAARGAARWAAAAAEAEAAARWAAAAAAAAEAEAEARWAAAEARWAAAEAEAAEAAEAEAEAARWAAYKGLAEKLFQIIDAEIEAASNV